MARVLTNPAPGRTITSPFGPRSGGDGFHNGVDFAGNNFVVVAAEAGTVVAVGGQYAPHVASGFNYIGAGNFVLIRHDHLGFRTGYAHLMEGSRTVEIGDTVTAGKVIGRSGNTGNSNGAHLHFDAWSGPSGYTSQMNPEPYIDWAYNPTHPTTPTDPTNPFPEENMSKTLMYRRTATGATVVANPAAGFAWHLPNGDYVGVLTSMPGLLAENQIKELSDTHFKTLADMITQGTNGAGNAKIAQLAV